MDNDDITPEQLLTAAEQLRDIDEFLRQCISTKVSPLLIGFDLDYLADRFEEAAHFRMALNKALDDV